MDDSSAFLYVNETQVKSKTSVLQFAKWVNISNFQVMSINFQKS